VSGNLLVMFKHAVAGLFGSVMAAR
jgi:hypothetical protein